MEDRITEQDSAYDDLQRMSVHDILTGINREDARVHEAVRRTIPVMELLVERIVGRMQRGGRMFYIGAGTSGRLGVTDASELPPTYGVPFDRVIGLIAGGDGALRRAVEHAEDDTEGAWRDMAPYHPTAGDVLIGMASSGVHSNGFSLVRKVFEMTKESLDTYYDELGGTLGETLIAPTKIYVKALKSVKDSGVTIKACSHVTGGGFYENIPRMLPDGVRAVIKKDSYEIPAIFKLLAEKGSIEEEMMYNTYNMGIGMVLAVDPSAVDTAMEAIREAGETPYVIGSVEAGEKGVTLC